MTNASPNAEKSWLDAIRRDWDTRARENARAYINWPDVPERRGRLLRLRQDGLRSLRNSVPQKNVFRSARKNCTRNRLRHRTHRALDVPGLRAIRRSGCLSGNDSQSLQLQFAPRAQFQAVSGGDLAGIPNDSVDFVWSFAVFQHVPDKRAIFNYFQEAARVLRPGGIFRLHMKGLWTLPLGRLMLEAGFPDRYRDRDKKSPKFKIPFVRLRYLDTWQGRSIRPDEAVHQCESVGLEVLDTEGEWTPMMWIGGRKK